MAITKMIGVRIQLWMNSSSSAIDVTGGCMPICLSCAMPMTSSWAKAARAEFNAPQLNAPHRRGGQCENTLQRHIDPPRPVGLL